ncbi:hypothetical protein V8C34DRAFT_287170 [Trichoderma compactum]
MAVSTFVSFAIVVLVVVPFGKVAADSRFFARTGTGTISHTALFLYLFCHCAVVTNDPLGREPEPGTQQEPGVFGQVWFASPRVLLLPPGHDGLVENSVRSSVVGPSAIGSLQLCILLTQPSPLWL